MRTSTPISLVACVLANPPSMFSTSRTRASEAQRIQFCWILRAGRLERRVLFRSDEDLHADIISGLCSREPSVDVLDIKNSGLRGSKDPVLLDLAAEQYRILITHDRRTNDALLPGAYRGWKMEPRHIHRPSEDRNRRYYRAPGSCVDCVEAGRVARSDRVPAPPMKTRAPFRPSIPRGSSNSRRYARGIKFPPGVRSSSRAAGS